MLYVWLAYPPNGRGGSRGGALGARAPSETSEVSFTKNWRPSSIDGPICNAMVKYIQSELLPRPSVSQRRPRRVQRSRASSKEF